MSETNYTAAKFDRALAKAGVQRTELRLFIAGMGPRSTRAIADLQRLCREHLGECCTVEIVDIYEHPEAAAQAQIIAVPTLVREHPRPQRKLIGAIGNLARVAQALGVLPVQAKAGS